MYLYYIIKYYQIPARATSIIYIYMIYNYQILSTTWPVPPYQANVSWAPRPQATGMMYGFPYQHWPKSRLWVVGWIEGWFLYIIIKALGNTSWFFCSVIWLFCGGLSLKSHKHTHVAKMDPRQNSQDQAFRFEGDLTALGTKQNHSQLITDTTGVSPVIW